MKELGGEGGGGGDTVEKRKQEEKASLKKVVQNTLDTCTCTRPPPPRGRWTSRAFQSDRHENNDLQDPKLLMIACSACSRDSLLYKQYILIGRFRRVTALETNSF